MKKNNKPKDHPEIENIKNICKVSPNTKNTKDICEKINKEKMNTPKQKKEKH